jgi:hypothetical protein
VSERLLFSELDIPGVEPVGYFGDFECWRLAVIYDFWGGTVRNISTDIVVTIAHLWQLSSHPDRFSLPIISNIPRTD